MAFGLNCLGGEGEEKEEEEDLLSFHSIVTFFSCLEVSLWFLIFFFAELGLSCSTWLFSWGMWDLVP